MSSLRMPISTASRKGVSGVVAAAEDQAVVLTNHGRAVALVEGANQVEASARLLREASLAVLDAAADLVEQRTPRFSLDEVCDRLGVSADHVRALVAARMSATL